MSSSPHSTPSNDHYAAPGQDHRPSPGERGAVGSMTSGTVPDRRIAELEAQVHHLQQQLTKQETQQRELDEFISLLAHDLRTPLTSIRGYAQLLLRQISSHGADVERLRSGLQTVIQQADRLSDLTNVLLDIARVRTGRLALRRGTVDLVHVAHLVIEEARSQLDAPAFRLNAPPSGPMVDGDSQRIAQALRSFVHFTVERTPPSHTVTVGVATVQETGQPRFAELTSSDEGSLLPPEEASRFFNQLVKPAQGGPMERALGRIDLYIARGIAEAHGGSVGVESPAPGKESGARLTMRLPLDQ